MVKAALESAAPDAEQDGEIVPEGGEEENPAEEDETLEGPFTRCPFHKLSLMNLLSFINSKFIEKNVLQTM